MMLGEFYFMEQQLSEIKNKNNIRGNLLEGPNDNTTDWQPTKLITPMVNGIANDSSHYHWDAKGLLDKGTTVP